MLSQAGRRGVQQAELNGNVDSENIMEVSQLTYVLHRTGCSQKDDQLLRQGCERSDLPGRQDRGDAMRVGRLDANASAALDCGDGGHDLHWLDL
jgi:hypothetical protein